MKLQGRKIRDIVGSAWEPVNQHVPAEVKQRWGVARRYSGGGWLAWRQVRGLSFPTTVGCRHEHRTREEAVACADETAASWSYITDPNDWTEVVSDGT